MTNEKHDHGSSGHGPDTSELTEEEIRALFEQPAWDERYRAKDALFSGNPNRQVVAETEGLTPGTALDVGCGEGGDAIWLAGRGWRVTGTDFSAVALDRCAALAERAGVADRTEWRQADARTWQPDGEQWDLVSSQFIHLSDGGMPDLVRRLGDAVAPGGTLLVVGHHPSDLETGLRWSINDILFTPEDLLPGLDAGRLGRPHRGPGPRGATTASTVRDSVLVARRR